MWSPTAATPVSFTVIFSLAALCSRATGLTVSVGREAGPDENSYKDRIYTAMEDMMTDRPKHHKSKHKPGAHTFVKFNQRGVWSKLSKAGTCHFSKNDFTADGKGTALILKKNFVDCKAFCEGYELCKGMEHRQKDRRCAIWTYTPGYARPQGGSVCYRVIQLAMPWKAYHESKCRLDQDDQTEDAKGTVRIYNGISQLNCHNACERDIECKGIEYYAGTLRCEVWRRDIMYQLQGQPGFSCHLFKRLKVAPVMELVSPSKFESEVATMQVPWHTWGHNSTCQIDESDDTKDGRGTALVRMGVRLLSACMNLCEQDPACHGIEFQQKLNRCEVWTQPIRKIGRRKGVQCMPYFRMAVAGVRVMDNAKLALGYNLVQKKEEAPNAHGHVPSAVAKPPPPLYVAPPPPEKPPFVRSYKKSSWKVKMDSKAGQDKSLDEFESSLNAAEAAKAGKPKEGGSTHAAPTKPRKAAGAGKAAKSSSPGKGAGKPPAKKPAQEALVEGSDEDAAGEGPKDEDPEEETEELIKAPSAGKVKPSAGKAKPSAGKVKPSAGKVKPSAKAHTTAALAMRHKTVGRVSWRSFGPGSICCQDSKDQSNPNLKLYDSIETINGCMDLCEDEDGCSGIQYQKEIGRCEMWNHAIHHAEKYDGMDGMECRMMSVAKPR